MNKRLVQRVYLLSSLFLCIACESQELVELKKITENIKKKTMPQMHNAFSFLEPQFSYHAAHLRSPFAEHLEQGSSQLGGSELREVGKIEKNSAIWLLMEDEKGVVHVVLEKK